MLIGMGESLYMAHALAIFHAQEFDFSIGLAFRNIGPGEGIQ
jgi:hypothetical protein